MNGFEKLGLSDNLLKALTKKGFTEPTPIQKKIIPMLLTEERDIIGQASTGTGKTAAFGLPIIERISEDVKNVQALILTPTRELALQVSDEINSLKGSKRIRVLPVYGGQPYDRQLKGLRRGTDVVVGTPGRVLDHLKRRSLRLNDLSIFVLDEADEMCNMGFIDDVREILGQAGPERSTLMFSATMPREVMSIASEFMQNHELVAVKPKKNEAILTRQIFHEMADSDRFEALCRVIDAEPDFYGLVFCRTKLDTDRVAERLSERGYPAEPIHGDLSQVRREDILGKFRKGKVTILVATDVAARGIDIPDLTHVINFSLPQNPETYVHRIGRTGRAGKSGSAVSLVAPNEYRRMMFIARSVGATITKEKLPRIEEVIRNKKFRATSEIEAVLESGGFEAYLPMARELMQDKEPEDVLAALLRHSFGSELDKGSYRELDAPGPGKGRVRLKASIGRADGVSPRKFVDFICRRTRLKPFKVQNVKVKGRMTTFTVPFRDVEPVLKAFGRPAKGHRVLVGKV